MAPHIPFSTAALAVGASKSPSQATHTANATCGCVSPAKTGINSRAHLRDAGWHAGALYSSPGPADTSIAHFQRFSSQLPVRCTWCDWADAQWPSLVAELVEEKPKSECKDLDGSKHPKQRQTGSNTTESTHTGREAANSLAIIHTLDQAGSDRRAQGEVLSRKAHLGTSQRVFEAKLKAQGQKQVLSPCCTIPSSPGPCADTQNTHRSTLHSQQPPAR